MESLKNQKSNEMKKSYFVKLSIAIIVSFLSRSNDIGFFVAVLVTVGVLYLIDWYYYLKQKEEKHEQIEWLLQRPGK